ncbi:HD domain-containing protein [Aquincola sp. S2]|uniref:HD domain-containing protein n=1 Tax=Pseudaquabacterium terrae TaxID=2732868 RepID=A0ABX2E9R5_9BURK|nr:HD domain-containing phosphohydrolase [Aquabacterium terrae]NRF65513.1 HD domain-containing protein [Aquabacterium terrae]
MNQPARQPAAFATANPHALATILEASQTKSIIASRDIFDLSGTKLWARDQPVSATLQRKLLDRQLRNPLESCLLAEDGVTTQTLVQGLRRLVEGTTPLAALLRPHAARLEREVPQLPLHSVVQLLLTAGQASRPESFEHALQGMALAGALMAAQGGSTAELRLAMLCGLLHDLGEMYIAPHHGEADADRVLDVQSYQHLVVHPHVGQLLLTQLTNYPAAMARAIGEHHERLDGSGYPHGLQRDAVSPLGRLLAVTEAALAVLRGERPYLARISVALRVVPGEFDLGWVGRIAEAARCEPELHPALKTADVRMRLARLDAALEAAQDGVAAAKGEAKAPALADALGLAQHLLGRLRTGWYASGLWSADALGNAHDTAEVEAVEDELFFRLQAIERAARLRAGTLPEADAQVLERLCEDLRAYSG